MGDHLFGGLSLFTHEEHVALRREKLFDWDHQNINSLLEDCGLDPLSVDQINDIARLRQIAQAGLPMYPTEQPRRELDEAIAKRVLFHRRYSIPPHCVAAWAVAVAFVETIKLISSFIDDRRILIRRARQVAVAEITIAQLLNVPRLPKEALIKLQDISDLFKQMSGDIRKLEPALRKKPRGYKEFGTLVVLCAELYEKFKGRPPTVSHSGDNKAKVTGPFVDFVERFLAPLAPSKPCSWWPPTRESRANKIDNTLKASRKSPSNGAVGYK
jgi:hypothetical protein